MKLSTKGRYAVMAMADLAEAAGKGPVTLAQISDRQGISLAYLEQLLNKLRRAGLVEATRGPNGGYRLSSAPGDIRLADIMFAVDEPVRTNACPNGSEAGCLGKGRCSCHDLWNALGAHILSFLGAVSLTDIVAGTADRFVAPGLGCAALRSAGGSLSASDAIAPAMPAAAEGG